MESFLSIAFIVALLKLFGVIHLSWGGVIGTSALIYAAWVAFVLAFVLLRTIVDKLGI